MYIDLNVEVKTNAEFRYKLNQITQDIHRLERLSGEDPNVSDKIGERILDIFRLCKYNAGLLVPFMFPKYPGNKPLSCSARPYSYAMFHMQIGGFLSFRSSRQIGKCLVKSTSITTRYKNIEKCMTAEEIFTVAEKESI